MKGGVHLAQCSPTVEFSLGVSSVARVARTSGSGWDPYTRFRRVPLLEVVRDWKDLCALKLFAESRNLFIYFLKVKLYTSFIL